MYTKSLLFLLFSGDIQAINTWTDGPTFDIAYDKTSSKLKYTVMVPDNMYLGLAYGTGMSSGTDMVSFQAKDNGIVTDLYATGYGSPSTDPTNDYTDTVVTKSNGKYNFVTYRKTNTADDKDTTLSCSVTQNFKWVGNTSSSAIIKHNRTGSWTLNLGLNDDCSVKAVVPDANKDDGAKNDTTEKKDESAKIATDEKIPANSLFLSLEAMTGFLMVLVA